MAPRTARRRPIPPLAPAAAALLLLAACGGGRPAVEGQPGPRVVLTDANVASIVMTANNAEIGEAQLALARSENTAVREFAQRMITDHGNANQRLMQIANRTGMQPEEIGSQLQSASQQARQSLQARTGAEFDRAYIANQINVHRWLLDTIDNTLVPAARDDRLEDYLVALRPTVADHLQQAQRIQQTLR